MSSIDEDMRCSAEKPPPPIIHVLLHMGAPLFAILRRKGVKIQTNKHVSGLTGTPRALPDAPKASRVHIQTQRCMESAARLRLAPIMALRLRRRHGRRRSVMCWPISFVFNLETLLTPQMQYSEYPSIHLYINTRDSYH